MTEKFTFRAGYCTALSEDEEGVLLIDSRLDESVKWIDVPTIGICMVKKQIQLICPICRATSHDCLLVDGKHKSNPGESVAVMECTSVNQYLVLLVPNDV